MNKKDELTAYANKLFQELRPRLQKDVEADMVIYPTSGRGAVVEVKLQRGRGQAAKKMKFEEDSPTINHVLKKIPQRLIGGNIDAVQFSGTNISLEENRILLIKGDDQHWSESDAVADISRVLDANKGGKR